MHRRLGPATAQELRTGVTAAVDRDVQLHVSEPLLMQDAGMEPQPALAQSWKAAWGMRRDLSVPVRGNGCTVATIIKGAP